MATENINYKPMTADSLSAVLPFFLSHLSPWLLIGVWVAAVIGRLSIATASWTELLIPVAVVGLWSFQEWVIHVFILHYKPTTIGGVTIDFHVAQEHRTHHQEPWRPEKIFIPWRTLILQYLTVLPALTWISSELIGWQHTFTIGIVYFSGALIYEWTHFLIHTSFKPKTKWFKRLQRDHRLHHFKNENFWYGVCTNAADRALGTTPSPKDVERSETAKKIVS